MRIRNLFLFAPTRRLATVVALLAPVWIASSSHAGFLVAVVAAAAVAVAIGVDVVVLPAARDVEVTRAFPPSVGVGDDAEGTYSVLSHWGRAFECSFADRLPAGIEATRALPAAVAVAPGTAVRIERAFRGERRGDHLLGPVALRVLGPLGFVTRTLRYELDGSIRGIPSVAAVRLFRLVSVQKRMRAPGIRAVRPRGEGQSFANLRDYSLGDDPRHIDWKASARRAKLITREFSLEQGQQILIAIDAGRLMTQIAGTQPRFEYALSSALVLADIAAHSGDAVGVMVFNDSVLRYVAPARGAGAVRAVRDALTAVDATLVEPDYAAAFRTIAARQHNRALIVLFTDVLDVRSSNTLIAHLALSAARHLPLVVALRNEDLTVAARPGDKHSASDVFRAAAAEELLTARETALAKMRATGVSVVNVAPNAMTAAVVNRYLDIKARGAL